MTLTHGHFPRKCHSGLHSIKRTRQTVAACLVLNFSINPYTSAQLLFCLCSSLCACSRALRASGLSRSAKNAAGPRPALFFRLRVSLLSCSRRSALLSCHAAAAARRAASLRLGLKTGLLRSPSVFRPRSGPSALLLSLIHI